MAAKRKKKIFLLVAGGTCILDNQGHILVVNSKGDISNWLSLMPELNILADIEPIFVSGEDETISPQVWQNISKFIKDREKQADGFVVVSKIDQLINTSLALNFLLQNFKKSIILTSSQVSGSSFIDKKEIISRLKSKHGGLGLRTNLINAIQMASEAIPEPAILFGARLIAATKAQHSLSNEINNFVSIDNNYLAKIDFGINLKSGLKYSTKQTETYKNISAKVLVIEDVPGTEWHFSKDDLAKYDGLFIKVSPFQDLEKAKKDMINNWQIPTVVYNLQSSSPVKGAVSLSDCTFNAALMKTIWALSNKKELPNFEDVMKRNIIGEFNR